MSREKLARVLLLDQHDLIGRVLAALLGRTLELGLLHDAGILDYFSERTSEQGPST